jgi:hypothetical protein
MTPILAPAVLAGAAAPPVGAHAVHVDRLVDVFDFLRGLEVEAEIDLALDRVVDRTGDANAPGLRQRLHARGDVDAVAVDAAVLFLDHVAEIDADAKLHAAVGREFEIAPLEHLLNLASRLDGFDGAGELGQNIVAGRVDDAALVARDDTRDGAAVFAQGRHRGGFVVAHEARITGHVGAHDRGELAPRLFTRHERLP